MRTLKTLLATAIVLLPLSAANAPQIPRKAAEFAIQMNDGSQILLSKYRGKVVLLEFLFTTCPHCQDSARVISRLNSEYGPKGFQPLGIAFNDMSKMLVPDFIRDQKANFPVGFASREQVQTFLDSNPDLALHVPQVVLIDKKGMIRVQSKQQDDGGTAAEANLRAQIEKLLKETGGAATHGTAAKKKTS